MEGAAGGAGSAHGVRAVLPHAQVGRRRCRTGTQLESEGGLCAALTRNGRRRDGDSDVHMVREQHILAARQGCRRVALHRASAHACGASARAACPLSACGVPLGMAHSRPSSGAAPAAPWSIPGHRGPRWVPCDPQPAPGPLPNPQRAQHALRATFFRGRRSRTLGEGDRNSYLIVSSTKGVGGSTWARTPELGSGVHQYEQTTSTSNPTARRAGLFVTSRPGELFI